MIKIKSIRTKKKLAGKTILLRADFNIPIENGKIKDDFRIVAELPLIRYLLRHRAKIIIMTHLGQPKFDKHKKVINQEEFSVRPIAAKISKLLHRKIWFINNCVGAKVKQTAKKMKDQDILLLENLRFYQEEEKNDKKFAKELSACADLYINDAFSVSHRNHASVSAIKKYLPSFAGSLIEREVKSLHRVMKPAKPLISIIGGAKISTKTGLIKNLLKISDYVLVGGAVANCFLAARGFEVGRSLVDKKSILLAGKLDCKKIILPIDAIVGNNKAQQKVAKKELIKISKNDSIFDIGPATIKLYAKYIKQGKTIVWNGPIGMFENEKFKHGTMALARLIAARSTGRAFGVVGGGETVEALKLTKMFDYVDWVSTGGGAMLSYLGGEKMPGLKGIVKN